jgi:hypothetical protein
MKSLIIKTIKIWTLKKLRNLTWQKAPATYKEWNPEKVKQSSKKTTEWCIHNNPENVEESRIRATTFYRNINSEKVKHSSKKTTAWCIHNNPEKVEESRKRATAFYRNLNPEKVVESSKN